MHPDDLKKMAQAARDDPERFLGSELYATAVAAAVTFASNSAHLPSDSALVATAFLHGFIAGFGTALVVTASSQPLTPDFKA